MRLVQVVGVVMFGARRWCVLIGSNRLLSEFLLEMGNSESAAPGEKPVGDSQLQHYSQLFRDLTAPDHTGKPIDDKIFRVSS